MYVFAKESLFERFNRRTYVFTLFYTLALNFKYIFGYLLATSYFYQITESFSIIFCQLCKKSVHKSDSERSIRLNNDLKRNVRNQTLSSKYLSNGRISTCELKILFFIAGELLAIPVRRERY